MVNPLAINGGFMKFLALLAFSLFFGHAAQAAIVCNSVNTGILAISHEVVDMGGDKIGLHTKIVNNETQEVTEDVIEVAEINGTGEKAYLRTVQFLNDENQPSYFQIDVAKKEGTENILTGGGMIYRSRDGGKTFVRQLGWALTCTVSE